MRGEKLEVTRGSGNVFRDLGRFTIDRLMSIINRLGSRVEVKVRVSPSAGLRRFPRPLSLSK